MRAVFAVRALRSPLPSDRGNLRVEFSVLHVDDAMYRIDGIIDAGRFNHDVAVQPV
jgi:hypothetical protein